MIDILNLSYSPKKDIVMKKGILYILSFVFAVSMIVSMVEAPVSAISWSPPEPVEQPAEGDWQYAQAVPGEDVHMSELTVPAPEDWMLLMSNGVRLETMGATPLCHPFRGGQFGWVGGIYLLNGTSWMALPSTTEWVPDEEGQLMTCAQAPMSGVYALFGYCEDCVAEPVYFVRATALQFTLPESDYWVK
jgi:hypothetical protein